MQMSFLPESSALSPSERSAEQTGLASACILSSAVFPASVMNE